MALPAQSSSEAFQNPRLNPRLIAFYLPQFHPTPENDVFWGAGFTEWSNVVRARPLFPGHYQPRLPADLGFYDLRLPEVRQAQADLAREHGVHGFCYHHYWSKGGRVLSRPLDEVLESGQPDFPFCLSWANHNWTWRRDARDQGRLIAQEYSEEDDLNHIRWLLGVFQDERYIRVGDRPLLLIYHAHELPDSQRTLALWREEAEKAGVAEPYICKAETMGNFDDPRDHGCDAAVEFWPHGIPAVAGQVPGPESYYQEHKIHEYRDLVKGQLERPEAPFRRFPCVVPSWDNTARFKGEGARVIRGSTPDLYESWLEGVIENVSSNPTEEQLIFINAWNEWGEGTYLEPDFKYGKAYLEATSRALTRFGVEVTPDPALSDGKSEEAVPEPASPEARYRDLLVKYTQLQERMTELLNIEERSELVKKAEQRNAQLKQRYAELAGDYRKMQLHRQQLMERLRDYDEKLPGGKNRERRMLHEQQRDRHDIALLVDWMNQIDVNVSALLDSRRWKLGGVLVEFVRRVMRKPRTPTAADALFQTLSAFNNWRREYEERE